MIAGAQVMHIAKRALDRVGTWTIGRQKEYGKPLWRIVQGDWGRSMFSRRPVFDEILHKLPLTRELIVLALLFELVIAVAAGVIAAVKPYTWWDYGAVTFAVGTQCSSH